MKKILLATAALVCFSVRAHAQFIVDAPVLDVLQTTSLVHQVTELARWAAQAQQMIQQINQLQMTYNALAHATTYGSVVGALQMAGIRNPLPISPYAVQGLMNGTGGTGGMLGNVGTLLGGMKSANTVYTPTALTWVPQEVARNGSGLAGAQALALQQYQSAGQRIDALTELQSQINSADDPSKRESLVARLEAEQAYVQAENTRAAVLGNYMEAEYRVRDQRATEKTQMDAASFISRAQADGAW